MPYKNKRVKVNWPESKRIEVVQAYILLGNLRQAGASCNVPDPTVRVWRSSQWWRDTEAELRRSSKLQLSAKLSNTVLKSLTVVDDRLENGDFQWNAREGVFVRKPVSAEHANKITTQLIDRTLLLEKAASVDKIDDVGVEARLKKLMQDIAGFARKPKLPIIEGEYVEVDRTEKQSQGLLQELVLEGNESIQQGVENGISRL